MVGDLETGVFVGSKSAERDSGQEDQAFDWIFEQIVREGSRAQVNR